MSGYGYGPPPPPPPPSREAGDFKVLGVAAASIPVLETIMDLLRLRSNIRVNPIHHIIRLPTAAHMLL
ncbi:hypothetical protein H634G_07920 [Metarhizium anisopliae BRIP 53293]|uniref:Uncharacterized protein n=1 Tax=Metarhizium anisopliae BRIP 53293 TaxID=1291518 RepID=A0A0D9NSY0_METAN|nr:hypothetical protein H634G_07920 [Metarhizium anisopliae BRIP 53293]KJK93585.1 hypothetical protein H633G_02536 [Metarhizium anisopliae BRIP 53284]